MDIWGAAVVPGMFIRTKLQKAFWLRKNRADLLDSPCRYSLPFCSRGFAFLNITLGVHIARLFENQ